MSPSRESTLLLAGMVIFSSLLLDQISTWAGLVLCETSTPPVPWKVIRQSVPWPSEVSRALNRVGGHPVQVQAAAQGGQRGLSLTQGGAALAHGLGG